MFQSFKRSLILLAAISSVANLQAQYKYFKDHGVALSVGGDGHFDTQLTSNPLSTAQVVSTPTGGVITTTVSNQQQFTTLSAGFVGSLQFHPKPWAGVEVNYGYTHYSERFGFNYSSNTAPQTVNVRTGVHEATGAYQFHPHHIPFQPFVNVGGGALFFLPSRSAYQTRGVGLLEAGFDIPTHNPHLAFRVQGRGLFYRAPNFYNSAISTRSWRATSEPSFGAVYRF